MEQNYDFTDEITQIKKIRNRSEKTEAFQKLDEKRRWILASHRGWRVRIGLMSETTDSSKPIPIETERVEGHAGDTTTMKCRLNFAEPVNLGNFNTYRILSIRFVR